MIATAEFCLGFRFAGSAHLAGPDGSPSWPPEPCRVVAAMLATAAHHRLDPAPLQVLEAVAPHVFYREDILPVPDYALSVPGNQTAQHPLALRRRPYMALPRTGIHAAYTWQVPTDRVAGLSEIGRRVSHLGAGVSLVTADRLPGAPNAILVPDREGHRSLRCAPRGYIQALLEAFQTGKPAPYQGHEVRYRWGDHSPSETTGPWHSTSGALRLSAPVDAADGVHLAAAVRSAVMSILDDIPPAVHGHQGASTIHVAWVPIPHREVLLGVGCWTPRAMPSDQAQRVMATFARLRAVRFRDRTLQLSLSGQGLLQDRRWAGYATTWESVTPIALLRHPRRKLTANDIIVEGLVRDGYPEPETVRITQWGVPVRTRHSRAPRVHAVITWSQPLRGPVLVGAERHFGLGLCRPVPPRHDSV